MEAADLVLKVLTMKLRTFHFYCHARDERRTHRWMKSHQNPQKTTKTTKNPKNCFLVFLVDGLFVCTPKTPKPPISPKYAGHVMCVMLMYF